MKTLRFKILDWLSGGLLSDWSEAADMADARAATTARLNEELRRKLYVTEAKLFEVRKDLDIAQARIRQGVFPIAENFHAEKYSGPL